MSEMEPGIRTWMLRLGLVGLAARLVVIGMWSHTYRPTSDADQYLDIASNLSAGRGFGMQWPQMQVHATAFRPPAWPALLSVWLWVFGDDPSVARFLNVLIGSVCVALTYVVGRRCSSHIGGVVAALFVAFYPPLLANDITTLAEPLSHLVILAIVLAAMSRRTVVLGLLLGLLVLTKPSAQLIALGVLLVVPLMVTAGDGEARPARLRRAAMTAGALALTAALVVVPWIIRNHERVHTWSVVTSNGFNLMAVYGERAREIGDFVDPVYDPENQSLDERLLRFDEAQWSATLTRRGTDGIREDPAYVVDVVGRNLLSWFELTPGRNDSPEALDGRIPVLRTVGIPLFYVVTLLGAAGIVLEWRRRTVHRVALATLSVVAFMAMAASLPFVSPPRLRGAFDLAACIGVGLLAHIVHERRGNHLAMNPLLVD